MAFEGNSYRLTADIRMPHFRIKLHHWWLERVIVRYPNINGVHAPFVRCSGRALEFTLQMRKVIAMHGLCRDMRVCVCVDVCHLFCYTSDSARRHSSTIKTRVVRRLIPSRSTPDKQAVCSMPGLTSRPVLVSRMQVDEEQKRARIFTELEV